MRITIKLLDKRTNKIFEKEFKSEFERDNYLRKSRYFKNIVVLEDNKDRWID